MLTDAFTTNSAMNTLRQARKSKVLITVCSDIDSELKAKLFINHVRSDIRPKQSS